MAPRHPEMVPQEAETMDGGVAVTVVVIVVVVGTSIDSEGTTGDQTEGMMHHGVVTDQHGVGEDSLVQVVMVQDPRVDHGKRPVPVLQREVMAPQVGVVTEEVHGANIVFETEFKMIRS